MGTKKKKDIIHRHRNRKILKHTALNKMFSLNFPAQTSGNPAKEEEEEVGERQQQAEGVGETE